MTTHPTLNKLTEQVRQIWDERYAANIRKFNPNAEVECHFHLFPCGQCSAPSWQQPCPWCGFYPTSNREWSIATRDREENRFPYPQFERLINRSGNFAVFYFSYLERIGQMHPAAVEVARQLKDCPSAEEIWNAVIEEQASLIAK